MNLHPAMGLVQDIAAVNPHVRANRRDYQVAAEAAAGFDRIELGNLMLADRLEHQITFLLVGVLIIRHAAELWVEPEPYVKIAIRLAADVLDDSCNPRALLQHLKPSWVIHMIP